MCTWWARPSLAAGHKTLVPAVAGRAEEAGRGGHNRGDRRWRDSAKQDYDFLYKAGVKCVFGPGTPIPVAAKEVLAAIKV
jgi:methylmalonyl-CoA mutase